jgi:hypothetical protein
VPPPTPFVPDAQTFLTLIGRNLSQHASKIPTWEALFSLTSMQLRELGVEPPRSRRYLLRWRDKFRQGIYGVAGDATIVQDGKAVFRAVEVPRAGEGKGQATATQNAGTKKIVVNIAEEVATASPLPLTPEELAQLEPIKGLKIKGAHTIIGPNVLPVKGSGGKVAAISVREGLWEERRGHKIDGGERRQAEVRSKRRAEERKTSRG